MVPKTGSSWRWSLWSAALLLTAACSADARPSASSTPQSAEATARAAAVDSLVQPLLEGHWVGGVAIALLDAEGAQFLSYGDRRPGGPAIDPDTLFELGSLTKLFTAALLEQMVERGELKLDDPVAALLPAGTTLPSGGGEQITLLDLATHHSGLPRVPDDLPVDDPNPYARYDVEQLYAFLARTELASAPGVAYEYSNVGFALLGNALSLRAGKAYETLILEQVAAPLQMHDTWFGLTDAQRARLALGHDADTAPSAPWDFLAFAPTGALRSSLRDMSHWLAGALATEPDAAGAALRASMKGRRAIPGGQIGLAWHIMRDGLVWHNGETGGQHSFMAVDPERGKGVLVLADSAGGIVDTLSMALVQLMRGHEAQPLELPQDMALEPSKLDEYVGTYRFAPDFAVELWRDGDTLRGQATDEPSFRLWPSDTDLFYLRVLAAQIDFQRNPDGKIVSLIFHQSGLTQQALRDPAP